MHAAIFGPMITVTTPDMQQASTIPGSALLSARLKRLFASVGVVALFSGTYAVAPYNREQMDHLFAIVTHSAVSASFTGREFLVAAALLYSLLLGAYHLLAPDLGLTKSVRFFRVLWMFIRSPAAVLRQGLQREDRVAVLATLLKGFFAPMMAVSLMTFCVSVFNHGGAILAQLGSDFGFMTLFNQHGFWVLMKTIFFIDVLIFTAGYLVESPRLGNEIRSVDPTLLGWAAALMCYPPFNYVTGKILGSQVSDFPQFDDPTVHVVLNVAMLILMAIYAWASVALGLKASNLTHRGIIAHGPYAFIRHPAYICKNMAWWIGAIPFLSLAFGQSFYEGVLSAASVIGWSMLYVLRALTEEDHLRRVDGEYAAYEARVRYRFIPGVY
jgi:protein-S-isoprenylcysteine O-methyltransferase Ste14